MKKVILILASVFMLTSCIYEDYHHYPTSNRRPPYNNGNRRPPNHGRPPYNNGNKRPPSHGRPSRPGNHNNGRH
jgi:hypothetical protein